MVSQKKIGGNTMVSMVAHTSSQHTATSRQERVPEMLQTVFLSSNRGKDVSVAPPERVASKTFFKNWFFQRQTTAPIVPRTQKLYRSLIFPYPEPKNNESSSESETVVSDESQKNTIQQPSPPPVNSRSPGSSPREPKARKKEPAPFTTAPIVMSPQGYLDSLLRQRGYSSQKFRTLETAYYNKPTPLQLASYHVHLVEVMKQNDGKSLQELIRAGLSRNPCNQHGESLVHTVCRRGDYKLLQVMIGVGASLQVSDDHGRTPLHDACWSWSSSFAAVDIVLQHDPHLIHMMDARGATPLMYVRNENWPSWLKFLRSRTEIYWPRRNVEKEGKQPPPSLTLEGPNTRPMPNPEDALPIDLATMVASGRITPNEAAFLRIEYSDDDSEDDSESGSYSDSDYSDSDYSDSEIEDEEEEGEEGCPDALNLSSESSDSPNSLSMQEASQEEDEDDADFFDESEIAELIRGITAPGERKAVWTSSHG